MKNSNKVKKIIIAIIAVIIIAAITVGILLATGVWDVNLSKKSKMSAGIEKLGESFTEPLKNLFEQNEENGNELKVLNNYESSSAFEVSTELSTKIDKLEIEDASTDQSDIDDIVDLLNQTKLKLTAKYDGDKSAYVKLDGEVEDVELSGEAVYDGSQLGIRSETINSKWLTLSEKDIEDILKQEGVSLDEIKEMITTGMESANKVSESVDIDEKTQKEISERYEKVFKDFINSKSKEIESKKDKVEVNGKDKSCQKLTLELDDNDLKELLKEYVETFKDDEQLKEILQNTMNTFAEMATELDEDSAEEFKNVVDEIYNNIDEINDAIDELEFDGSLKLIVYATSTKVYRTDIVLEIQDTKVSVETTFNKETTDINIAAKFQGVSIDIANITLTEKENGINLKVTPSKTIAKELGTDFSFEIDYVQEESKNEASIKVNAGEYGNGTITVKSEITKNDDKEYEDTTTLSIDVNIPDYIVAKMDLIAKSNIKVGEASIPTIPKKESIDMNDQTAVQNYLTESQEKINDLVEKFEDTEVLESLVEEMQ